MKADYPFDHCTTFSLIFFPVVGKYFLYLLLPITSGMPKDIDIKNAYDDVDFILKSLKKARTAVIDIHNDLFLKAVNLGRYVAANPEKKRTSTRQIHRNNSPSSSVNDYYRLNVPFLSWTSSLQR